MRGLEVSNVVKLKGFERAVVESFNHEPDGPWHFEVEVWEATSEELSQSQQRLTPDEQIDYIHGDLNLFVLKVRACVDPTWLGTSVSSPVWVKGLTFSDGQIRTETGKAISSAWFDSLCFQAKRAGVERLADILGRLSMGNARDEVERRAGLR